MILTLCLAIFEYTLLFVPRDLPYLQFFLFEVFFKKAIASKIIENLMKLTDKVSVSSIRLDVASIVFSKSLGSFSTMSVFVLSKLG